MGKVAEIQNIQSNILSYETLREYGFCREYTEGLVNTGDNLELGSVVFTTDGVAWNPVTADEITNKTATGVGIIIGFGDRGEAIEAEGTTATEKGMLIIQGIAIVRKQYLKGDGTEPDKDALQAYVEELMTLVNVDESFVEFDGTYNDVTPIT